jgi:uncharacterized RDD family membrane protein YckC
MSDARPSAEPILTADVIARTQEGSLIFQRWAATLLDTGVCMALYVTVGVLSQGEGDWPLPVWAVSVIAYYVVLEAHWGATLGKLALKIQVVDKAGRPPGYGKASVRTVLRFIEVNPLLAGGIPAGIVAGLSKTRQRLGDMLAGTYVLRVADVRRLRDVVDVSVF